MAFSHSPAEVVAQALIDSGLTFIYSSPQWPTFIGEEPDTPDKVVTIYDTTPVKDGRTMTDGEVILHYGLQIRIRSTNPKQGWTKLQAITDYLDGLSHKYVSMDDGNEYDINAMSNQNGILNLGKEEVTRLNIHVANYTATITQY